MIGMRTIDMSIRLEVNQSTVSLCGASIESIFVCLSICNNYYSVM